MALENDRKALVSSDQTASESPISAQKANKGGGSRRGRRLPPGILKDMRWVYTHTKVEGEKLRAGRKQCRELQESDPLEFMRMLHSLEKAHQVLRGKSVTASAGGGVENTGQSHNSSSPEAHDPSSEKVEALIEELLAGWEKEEGKRG